ncbi:MAG: hypothetical protein PHG80_12475 [Methanoregulaceae archaeon]|nr:hypothetical protein [Methanoregulaceae archaeon]
MSKRKNYNICERLTDGKNKKLMKDLVAKTKKDGKEHGIELCMFKDKLTPVSSCTGTECSLGQPYLKRCEPDEKHVFVHTHPHRGIGALSLGDLGWSLDHNMDTICAIGTRGEHMHCASGFRAVKDKQKSFSNMASAWNDLKKVAGETQLLADFSDELFEGDERIEDDWGFLFTEYVKEKVPEISHCKGVLR